MSSSYKIELTVEKIVRLKSGHDKERDDWLHEISDRMMEAGEFLGLHEGTSVPKQRTLHSATPKEWEIRVADENAIDSTFYFSNFFNSRCFSINNNS